MLGRLFPYTEMFNWLSYGQDPHSTDNAIDKDYFSHREWSFTIEDDIYIRYQSFKDKDEMIAAIQKRQPHKIDIGAVFSGCPKDHNTIKADQFKPMERELVFDIDMTDYDDIRTCCSSAEICHRCWPYMTMAIKVIDRGRSNCCVNFYILCSPYIFIITIIIIIINIIIIITIYLFISILFVFIL